MNVRSAHVHVVRWRCVACAIIRIGAPLHWSAVPHASASRGTRLSSRSDRPHPACAVQQQARTRQPVNQHVYAQHMQQQVRCKGITAYLGVASLLHHRLGRDLHVQEFSNLLQFCDHHAAQRSVADEMTSKQAGRMEGRRTGGWRESHVVVRTALEILDDATVGEHVQLILRDRTQRNTCLPGTNTTGGRRGE